jgi:putative endonuclease
MATSQHTERPNTERATRDSAGSTPRNLRAEGTSAEALAVAFLEERGFTIVKRNFHCGRQGEIDIIAEVQTPVAMPFGRTATATAQTETTLVFVEVKARKTSLYGTPEEGVTRSKQQKLRRAAEGFLHTRYARSTQNGASVPPCRFDVIAIEFHDDTAPTPIIRHLENAF